jgi:hypothetical protein
MNNAADQRFPTTAETDGEDPVVQWERIALGHLLVMPDTVEHLLALRVDDFSVVAHQQIFAAIVARTETAVDNTAVLRDVIGARAVAGFGDPMLYLSRLRNEALDTAGDFSFHAARLREVSDARKIGKAMIVAQRAVESGSKDLALKALEDVVQNLRRADALIPDQRRRVDLTPYVDGTHRPPRPAIGGLRDDGQLLLYKSLWHTCIAPTTSGKSWFALWHCVQEIRNGNTIAYAHFETASPAGTVRRLQLMAPDLTIDVITERFVWLDCTTPWSAGEFAAALPRGVVFVVLDGINAACGQHGWIVDKPEAVGAYRSKFVTPATTIGAAVLSLGHPVKAVDRQAERHGFGATGWLDEVDGVGFRLIASKKAPIGDGRVGHSTLFTVKDRESQVEKHGLFDLDGKREGWIRLGSFKVDSRPEKANTSVWLNVPQPSDEEAVAPDKAIDKVGRAAVAYLKENGSRFDSQRQLEESLRAAGVAVNRNEFAGCLARLAADGLIEWPEVSPRLARPGWLTGMEPADSF